MADERRVNEMLTMYLDNKEQITQMTRQNEQIRKELLELMDDLETNEFSTDIYDVTRSMRQRQNISKSCVPTDIWNRYAMITRYYNLSVEER
jgi:hypothetical protein